ncbi:polyprenyl synthetase family protein [Desulfolutivibrio sulfoxidireducens]|uniref:polyprenyl synthetase family protein n=1 Tax=Desulfolutivibrio sulfoxidireducens TaxID=2773299 RepID=UPI00159D6903|nr:farnesyl diphosphate synthase [Desulfolutivibrio sulfoxidireducens]QLA15557.1 polyprenyl synthetase family protein [Desulfolutivibrio sulfoxidireducens]QLA19157.1 polyprenyl synthetase family protein [Desulfolutivibrio sulfoxidireducens]
MWVRQKLADYAALTGDYLRERFGKKIREAGTPDTLVRPMEYSLLAGGKRLRPALCLAFAEVLGTPAERVLPFASAFELIHTYSLIHDDLPAMDDDDLRRGRPSCHKAFGEAQAILAGDALVTEAFGLMAETAPAVPERAVLTALAEAVFAAGSGGMVGGQMLDMDYTGAPGVTLAQVAAMQAKKTGALIRAACVCGAVLAQAAPGDVVRAAAYGQSLGAAFQIADDILDVVGDEKTIGKPVGSDQARGKNTFPSLAGLDRSREMALAEADAAVSAVAPYQGDAARFLRELARYVVDRVS